ncbi:hypothetical protein J6590_105187 [Homalodisca vitripennis]|nr:hypothetical protein J6590_105187 [Homalodisca vitripennis]
MSVWLCVIPPLAILLVLHGRQVCTDVHNEGFQTISAITNLDCGGSNANQPVREGEKAQTRPGRKRRHGGSSDYIAQHHRLRIRSFASTSEGRSDTERRRVRSYTKGRTGTSTEEETSTDVSDVYSHSCLPVPSTSSRESVSLDLQTVQQHIQTRKNATSHNEATTSIGINSGTDIQDAIPHCSSRHFCERALTSHPRSVVVHDIFECRTEEEARHMAEGILRQRRGPNVSLESRGRGFTLLGFHATNTGEGAFSHVHPVHDCRWAQYTCRCSCFRQLVRRGHTKRKTYKLESLQAKGLRLLAEYVLEYQKSQVLAEVSGQRWTIRCETGNVQMEGRSEFGCCGVVEARTDEFKCFFFQNI